jgi:hypothetical protein
MRWPVARIVLTNVYVYGGTAVVGTNVVGQLTAAFGS